MPSLIRFVLFCAFMAALGFGVMYALVIYVEPKPREVQVRIPSDILNTQ